MSTLEIMTKSNYTEEKNSDGYLNLLSIKDVFKIEQERFIQFCPISDEKGCDFYRVDSIVEALANFLY